MRRVQAGEFESFESLVRRYESALTRVATGMLGDAALAEDAVQETFLAVFAARHTYKPSLPFRTWLWTVLLNRCRQHHARRVRRPQVITHSALGIDTGSRIGEPALPESALAELLERERSVQLQRMLEELPETQADAIRLRFFAGLTYDEIALSMGISLGGARLRIRSALEKLSRRLRADEEIPDEL